MTVRELISVLADVPPDMLDVEAVVPVHLNELFPVASVSIHRNEGPHDHGFVRLNTPGTAFLVALAEEFERATGKPPR